MPSRASARPPLSICSADGARNRAQPIRPAKPLELVRSPVHDRPAGSPAERPLAPPPIGRSPRGRRASSLMPGNDRNAQPDPLVPASPRARRFSHDHLVAHARVARRGGRSSTASGRTGTGPPAAPSPAGSPASRSRWCPRPSAGAPPSQAVSSALVNVRLHQRLAAGDRHAAAGLVVEDPVAAHLVQHLGRRHRACRPSGWPRSGRPRRTAPQRVQATGAARTPPESSASGGSWSSGQALRHCPQRTHRVSTTISSGPAHWLSGLWHHQHASGQPFRNTVVRMPGPS